MVNEEHNTWLEKGVYDWNKWRRTNQSIIPDLRGANLETANLKTAYLERANLEGANLNRANFEGANLEGANLEGANLERANLEGASLRGASLRGASLRGANLNRANLRGASLKGANLEGANLNGANLNRANLIGVNLIGVNLNVANLKGANLNGANLNGANLNGANLNGANLNGAKLIRTQVLGTDFTEAKFTGACLENWNINSATKLNNIDCQYVYLKSDFQERRPSSGEFRLGEFTNLFQKALETVDLIFADGIDWKAFLLSFQELQAEYGEENLSVQAIEKKSGGAFIIRLEVPPEANKADIESQAKALYEIPLNVLETIYRNQLKAKDVQIEVFHKKNTNLWELVKLAASKPIQLQNTNNNSMVDKSKKQSTFNLQDAQFTGGLVNADIVNVQQICGKITNYTPEQKHNLAQAAVEI